MPRVILSKAAVRAIHRAIEGLFNRAKIRLLGRSYNPKKIVITVNAPPKPATHRADLSLPGIFRTTAAMERMKPDERIEESLMRVAEGYLDTQREKAKVETLNSVQNFLTAAETRGKPSDVQTVLGGELADIFGRVTRDVKRIVETEGTRTRNTSSLDAIAKVNAMAAIDDPLVYFAVVNDEHLCEECRRLHLMEDGITPRVYRLSTIGHGYHHRGESDPKLGGLHPHCRCTLVTIMPGYGFKDGKVTYLEAGHDEYQEQHNP